jgi:hypothetical protein
LHGAALFIPANSTRIGEKHHGLLGTQYYAEFLSTDLKKQHLPRRRLQNSDVLGNEDPLCGSLMKMITAPCRSAIRRHYLVKFRITDSEALAISIPRSEAAVIRHFQAKWLVVPDVKAD